MSEGDDQRAVLTVRPALDSDLEFLAAGCVGIVAHMQERASDPDSATPPTTSDPIHRLHAPSVRDAKILVTKVRW